jgi:hypothetical protein
MEFETAVRPLSGVQEKCKINLGNRIAVFERSNSYNYVSWNKKEAFYTLSGRSSKSSGMYEVLQVRTRIPCAAIEWRPRYKGCTKVAKYLAWKQAVISAWKFQIIAVFDCCYVEDYARGHDQKEYTASWTRSTTLST